MTKHIEKVQQARKKKLDNLFKKKQQEDRLETNPNNIIWTLNLRTLSKEEYEVFHFSLKLLIKIQVMLFATAKSVRDQISRNNLWKETQAHIERAKNSL